MKFDRELRLRQTTTVGNVVFLNEAARHYHVAMQASSRALALVTCEALLGAGSTVMTMEAYEAFEAVAKTKNCSVQIQTIDVGDALILCDLPLTVEDILGRLSA